MTSSHRLKSAVSSKKAVGEIIKEYLVREYHREDKNALDWHRKGNTPFFYWHDGRKTVFKDIYLYLKRKKIIPKENEVTTRNSSQD